MRYIFTLLIGFFSSLTILAQSTEKISGIITDESGKSVQAATVSLIKASDSAVVKFATSNKSGAYEFTDVRDGKYRISVTSVGYEKALSSVFETGEKNISVPVISIATTTKGLSGVTVQSRRPLVETKIDKMVVNVDASPTNVGNSALDVLEKSPGVTVDKDGNVSLKGKQGVIILIDGKRTFLGGEDLANLLRNMPANQLDQIELMTQPSAKYDASGNSGVINLKTKKGSQKGFNGSVNLSFIQARYPKSPNSFNFNYRKGKVNVFSNLSYAYWQGFSDVNIVRKIAGSTFDQLSKQRFKNNNYSARVGLDYAIDKKTTVGFSVNGIYSPRTFGSFSQSDIITNNHLDSSTKAYSDNKDPWKNFGLNLNMRKQIDSTGKEFSADFDYVTYASRSNQVSDNYTYFPDGSLTRNPFLLKGYLPSDINIYSGKIDYVHPLGKGLKMETGAKSSYVKTDNDAQYTNYNHSSKEWVVNERTNHFIYEENINAAYINFSKQIKKWGVQTGLRMENTIAKGKQFGNLTAKDTGFNKNYTQLFPTAYLSYAMNDKNQFGLSYGRRIERPNYQDMNPFQYFLDQYTYRQGNPNLTPQFTHNVELSHNYRGRLNTTLNYTYTTDIINDILKQIDATKTTYQTKENIAKRRNIGLAISYNAPINKWWTISMYVNGFHNHYEGIVNSLPLNVDLLSMFGNMSQQFRWGKGWNAEVSGFYRTKMQDGGIIVANPMGVVSFGFGKQILKTKGTIRLNLNDPFWIQKFHGYTKFGNIDADIRSKWDNRRVGLSFTYRFAKGQNAQPQRRRTSGSSQEEQNRAGGSGNGQQ